MEEQCIYYILHQDNAPVHKIFSIKQFIPDKHISIFEHLPYLSDLVLLDFHLLPKIKTMFKGIHFPFVENVKTEVVDLFKSLTPGELRNCLEQYKLYNTDIE